METPELASPRLKKLADQVARDPHATESFWAEIAESGTPLVEPVAEDGSVLVTLLARRTDDQSRPWVGALGLGGLAPNDREMRLLDGTDVLYWTRHAPTNLRTIYAFVDRPMSVEPLPDPLARQPYVFPPDEDVPEDREMAVGFLELPDAPAPRWSVASHEAPQGTVQLERFESSRLEGTRRIYTYVPAGYDPAAGPYATLILFDGWAFTELVQARVTLDNLIHAGAIPPTVAVMPESGDLETRERDLSFSDDFNAFITDELLPWARGRWNLATTPSRVVAGGGSLGGVAAAYLALRRPDVTRCVLSLSGAFQAAPKSDPEPVWFARELAHRDRLPIRFWLNAGSLETIGWDEAVSIVAANRHLRDVLAAKGYQVDYSEFPGGHDYFWWVETMADGLIAFLGPAAGA